MDIRVSEALWASSMVPEGIVENWRVADGSHVGVGDAIAAVTIEGAVHEIIAPRSGRLSIVALANTMIEPGSLLARLTVANPVT